jgi:hypothetical protein
MKIMNGLDLQAQRITNMADPSSTGDAATKQYVDNVARGLKWKTGVRAATTTNGTLASAFANGQVVDGVTLVTGDRILLKNQSTGAENGIYVVAASGAPTRATDADGNAPDGTSELAPGTAVSVAEGTTNGDTVWMITTNGTITVGTTATTWSQLAGGTTYTGGNGINVAGSVISAVQNTGIIVNGSGIGIDTSVVVRKFAANVGDGSSTTITLTHNLGTRDISVAVYDASTFNNVLCDINNATTNTVSLTFAVAPASNAYRALVVG